MPIRDGRTKAPAGTSALPDPRLRSARGPARRPPRGHGHQVNGQASGQRRYDLGQPRPESSAPDSRRGHGADLGERPRDRTQRARRAKGRCLRRASLREAPRTSCGFVGGAGQLGSSPRPSPDGLPDGGQPIKGKRLDGPTTARQNKSLPTEGKIRAAPLWAAAGGSDSVTAFWRCS